MGLTKKSLLALTVALLGSAAGCHMYFEEDSGAPPVDPPDGTIDGGPAPVTCDAGTANLIADGFGACLDFAEWQAAGLCDLASMNTQQGTCAACHGGGADGIQLNADCDLTFRGFATLAENLEDLFVPILDARGCAVGVEPGNICSSALISDIHPPFVCPNSLRDALAAQLQASLVRFEAGTCTP